MPPRLDDVRVTSLTFLSPFCCCHPPLSSFHFSRARALFFFFFSFLLARAPETSALFMGSRLQLHWRILHKGCTKSTAVASFGSSVYPSPPSPSSLLPPPSTTLSDFSTDVAASTIYPTPLRSEVKFVILFTYVRIHTLCIGGHIKRRVSRTIFPCYMISGKSV